MKRPDFNKEKQAYQWRKRDIMNLYRLLTNMRGMRGIQFLRTAGLLLEELRVWGSILSVQNCVPSLEAFSNYEYKISALQRKHGIITDADILANVDYQHELQELNESHKRVIDEYHEDMDLYNKMMDEPFTEADIRWQQFDETSIPENIPSELYFAILPLIRK